jgi:hypothetical protein
MRAGVVLGIVFLVVSGVTFAALQSQQAVLAGNTISSATADIKISTDNNTYSNSKTGFDFSNVIPGGPAVPAAGYPFFLKNSGSTASLIKMSVSSAPSNLNNVDLSKVSIIITRYGGGATQTFTLANLISSYADGGLALTENLPAGVFYQYKLQATMAADAFTGNGASLGNIDFVFTGTSVSG